MKVDPKAAVGVATASSTQPFKKLLAEARSEATQPHIPTPTVRSPVQVLPRAVAKGCVVNTQPAVTAQTLTRARTASHVEAERLTQHRAETHAQAQAHTQARGENLEALKERTVERILEIIAREFSPEATPAGAPMPALTPPTPQVTTQAPKVESSPEAQAAQAVALIERIEVFVKSQRPGLALTLNNSLGAHVEIERIGPKEIALKLVGHRGPPSAEAVGRIRDELRARGLKIGALSVA